MEWKDIVPKKSIRMTFLVKREEIDYIRNTLESYDGMAIVRTLDPDKAEIEVLVAPGCENIFLELIDYLRKNENIEIKT